MTDDLSRMDATDQAALVRSNQAAPLELVDAAIAALEKLNPELNAVIHPLFERARAEAAGPLPDGPFRGVPFLLKDLVAELDGTPFCEGSAFAGDYVSSGGDQELTAVIRERQTFQPGQQLYVTPLPGMVHMFDTETGERIQ